MIQSFSFFQKQKQRLDRYEQTIIEYANKKEQQIFHKSKSKLQTNQNENDTAQDQKEDDLQESSKDNDYGNSHKNHNVPLTQLQIDKVISLLQIYANLGKEAIFIDTFIETSLVYEFDILVNEAEKQLSKQQHTSKWLSRTYFLEAFFKALGMFFETKMPMLSAFFQAQEGNAE